MANYIDETGINIESLNEIVSNLENGFKNIYGQDIVLDSDTPDGQMINIFAQAKIDILNLAVSIYDSMNPDTVFGQAQDQLYKLVGLYRNKAKFSYVNVNVVVDRAVNLQGLDDQILDDNGSGYTVSDSNGNEVILTNSVSITQAGTYLLEFRAKNSGAVLFSPNTIKNMNTVILGVVSVNNPESQYLTGNNVETDSDFRVRFNKSRSLPSQGFNDGLEAQLLSIDNVSSVKVYQNRSSIVDSDGTPAHSIWVIVEGGSNESIAKIIYANLTDGCGMRGETSFLVQKKNGSYQPIFFDRPSSESLYIKATLKNISSGVIDEQEIKNSLVNSSDYGVYESADSASITCLLNNISKGEFVPYDVEVSLDGVSWDNYIEPSSKKGYFIVSSDKIELTVV